MKSPLTFLGLLIVSMGGIHTSNAALVSFDDVVTGPDWTLLPNGYNGLQWIGFGALNGMLQRPDSGYRIGTISASNVAFNVSGEPAFIRSSVPFGLESAHLTAQVVDGMEVKVQGWLGTTLAYENTFELSPTAPTFVEFNYATVDRVTFTPRPSTIFAMDDVVLSPPGSGTSCPFNLSPSSFAHGPGAETNTVSVTTQEGCAWAVQNANTWVTIMSSVNNSNSGTVTYRVATNPRAIARSGSITIANQLFQVSQAAGQEPTTHIPVNLGTIVVPAIGNEFRPGIQTPFFSFPSFAVSLLIDQDQGSGGGGVLPNITANWDTNIQFVLTVSAPEGMRFQVQVPPGRTARFGGSLLWEAKWRGGSCPVGPVLVKFDGLVGTPPDFTGSDAVLADAHGFFGFSEITSSAISENLVFDSVTFLGTVTPQYTGFESLDFFPRRDCSLIVLCQTPDPDTESLVTLIPKPPQPKIRVDELFPGGLQLMVQGPAGFTHVVEASQDLVLWTPISTNVMPSVVPFFHVQDTALPRPDWRFYRVRIP